MGKRRKRLTMRKYAKKYAGVRKTIEKLKGVVAEAIEDGVVTPEEEQQIAAAQEEVVKAVEALEEQKKEEKLEVVAEVVETPIVDELPSKTKKIEVAQDEKPKLKKTSPPPKPKKRSSASKNKTGTKVVRSRRKAESGPSN